MNTPAIQSREQRLQELYDFMQAHPEASDKTVLNVYCQKTELGKSQAYQDIAEVKNIITTLGKTNRAFHRYRANEMLLEIYRKAKEADDLRTMERAATSYAKINRVDIDAMKEENPLDITTLQVQPFTATDDPTVLGIKPIPNLQDKIQKLLKQYGAQSSDIEDINYEETDIEL